MAKSLGWHEKPPPDVRSVSDAMRRADQNKRDLPRIVQVYAYDWDLVILADEVDRLRRELHSASSTRNVAE